jgi:hypothetical protein
MNYETGRIKARVSFEGKMTEADPATGTRAFEYGYGTGSLSGGIKRLGEVADALADYVKRVQPESIGFSAGSPGLQKLYDKVAPRLAKQLGGKLVKQKAEPIEGYSADASGLTAQFLEGEYLIKFPKPRNWNKK